MCTESKPEDPAKAFTEADAKKQCGLCGHKAEGKGNWRCTNTNTPWELPRHLCDGFSQKPAAKRKPQPRKKGLPVPPGVKLIYLGRPMRLMPGQPVGSRDHQGVVTVAWMLPSPDTLHLGFSFCNPGQKGVPPGNCQVVLSGPSSTTGNPYPKGRPAVPPDSFCKVEGRDIAMKNLYDDPLVYRFLYNQKRAVCDVVKAVLSHDQRLRQFASIPPLLKVPSWTRTLVRKKRIEERSAGVFFFLGATCPPLSPCISHVNDALGYYLSLPKDGRMRRGEKA